MVELPSYRYQSSLLLERENVLDGVDGFGTFLDELRAHPHKTPHFLRFVALVELIHDSLDSTIRPRLKIIGSVPDVEDASDALAKIKDRINILYNFLYSVFRGSQVPRELYELVDLFLRDYRSKPGYVIHVADEIQTASFSDFLQTYKFQLIYPEFWSRVKDTRFYFIQITKKISRTDRTLDWSLVLHEVGHVIDTERSIVDNYIPSPTYLEALKIVESDVRLLRLPSWIVRAAKVKLLASEYLADCLATQTFGGIFGWRFLKEFLRMKDEFETPVTHPTPRRRLRRIALQLRNNLHLRTVSDAITREISHRMGTMRNPVEPSIDALPAILRSARRLTRNKLTLQRVRSELTRKLGQQPLNFDQLISQLQLDLVRGRPIILHPAILFLIYMHDFGKSDHPSAAEATLFTNASRELGIEPDVLQELVQQLLADCVRLYGVSRTFT